MKTFKDLVVAHHHKKKGVPYSGKPWAAINTENDAVIYFKTQYAAERLQRRWRVLHGRDFLTGEGINPEDDIEILEKTFAPGSLNIVEANARSFDEKYYVRQLGDDDTNLAGPFSFEEAQAWVDDHTAVQE